MWKIRSQYKYKLDHNSYSKLFYIREKTNNHKIR